MGGIGYGNLREKIEKQQSVILRFAIIQAGQAEMSALIYFISLILLARLCVCFPTILFQKQ